MSIHYRHPIQHSAPSAFQSTRRDRQHHCRGIGRGIIKSIRNSRRAGQCLGAPANASDRHFSRAYRNDLASGGAWYCRHCPPLSPSRETFNVASTKTRALTETCLPCSATRGRVKRQPLLRLFLFKSRQVASNLLKNPRFSWQLERSNRGNRGIIVHREDVSI